MTLTQRPNRLTTHFSERIPVVKRRISVLLRAKRGLGFERTRARMRRQHGTIQLFRSFANGSDESVTDYVAEENIIQSLPIQGTSFHVQVKADYFWDLWNVSLLQSLNAHNFHVL
jgi:hypothetical protein